MIVLNGAQGLSEALAQALSQGVAGLQLARNLLGGSGSGNGTSPDNREKRQRKAAAPGRPETSRPERAE